MTSFDPQRRAFLKGKVTHDEMRSAELRPPWAAPETDFIDRCTRCSRCIEQCPETILQKGDAGFPVVNFQKGECTFCADCVSACPESALIQIDESGPWTLRAVIGEQCLCTNGIQCLSCSDECESRAIHFQPDALGIACPTIDEAKCSGCGACFRGCPVSAINFVVTTESPPHAHIRP